MKKINIGGLITYSKEIKEAIKKGIPIVALESSIISHGMPYPHSLEMAKEIENLIRSHGARPATLAILDGRINVGLDAEILDAFAKAKDIVKVSSNNFEATLFSKETGGTTVAGSLKICDLQWQIFFFHLNLKKYNHNKGHKIIIYNQYNHNYLHN